MAQKEKFLVNHKKDILYYFIFFIIMLILNRASVIGIKIPFAASFVFALVLLKKNALILAPCYFISYIFYNLTIQGLIIALNTISALILLFLLFKIINKKINFTLSLFFCLISQVAFVYFNLTSVKNMVVSVVAFMVALMFLYVCFIGFSAIFFRGVQSRFTLDEGICLSIFFVAVFSGLSGLYLFNANLTNAMVFLIILLTSRIGTKLSTIYIACLAGFGASFATGGVTFIAIYVSLAVVCSIFNRMNKFFSPLVMIILDVVFGLFLNAYAYYSYLSIIPLLVASGIYLCLPEKIYAKMRGFSYSYDGSLADEFVVYGQKQMLKNKISRLSGLFKQMQVAYRNLSVGEIDRNVVCVSLTEDLINRHCKSCINYFGCLEKENIKNSIKQLFEFGLEKGKVTIIDANNLLTSECKKLSGLIGEVNQSLNNYFAYEKMIKTEDNSKMIIAEQFGGTGEILNELSEVVIGGENINHKASRELLDELTLNRVVANEVMVLENEQGIEKVVMIVRNLDVLSPNITLSLKSVFRLDFTLSLSKMTRLAGWSVLCFVPAAKYEVNVGFASSPISPENVSGDNYSVTKLGNNKVLFALCDGMGHGKRANEISTVALNLIESFYKSGFSSETIISSVNKILLPAGEENFTTLDACIIDKNSGTADFVKIGASNSVIKSVDSSKLITQESLPMGILNRVNFNVQKYILKNQDIIVLATDGVVDSFDSQEDFLNFVNNERVINVQMLASTILEEAESRSKEHKDDKTIITIKLSAKV